MANSTYKHLKNVCCNGFIIKKLIYWNGRTHSHSGWRPKSCIMILLLLLVGVMVQCLCYLIYLLLFDHDNLFCIIKKYVGICSNVLKLIKSYFSNRTQRVQIDNVLSDFSNIICGVPQGSVLGPLKLCLY